jgi:single-strand DNA-binding protein
MSRGLNKVMIIGNLGREPEMRYTPSGRPVTTFSVATSRTWNTSEGEKHVETEWFNVVAWSNLAEICKQYLTNQEGNKHTSVEIVANEMIILGERRESAEAGAEPESAEEEEFPF